MAWGTAHPSHPFEPSEFIVGGCAVCGDRGPDHPIHQCDVSPCPARSTHVVEFANGVKISYCPRHAAPHADLVVRVVRHRA